MTLSLLLLTEACNKEKDAYIPNPIEKQPEDDVDEQIPEPSTKAVLNMKLEETFQEIDGFGCAFAEWSHRIYANTAREKVMEELFSSKGLNLNFMRGEPFPHYEKDGVIDFGMDRKFNYKADDPTINKDFWNRVDELVQLGQMWITDHLKTKYPEVNLLYSTWSPPASMKTTGDKNKGKLKPESYQDFADYLVNFLNENKKRFGTSPYAISPSNEPNASSASWSACGWTAAELANFYVNNLRPTLDKGGYSDVKIMFCEHSWWGSGERYINDALKAQPTLKDLNVIAASHGYFTGDNLIKSYQGAEEAGIKVWNTELSNTSNYVDTWEDGMKWAKTFHTYLSKANLSAIIWWAGARPTANNESLIKLEEAIPGTTYWKPKRFHAFGHFSKYIKPGSRRVEIEQAYLDDDKTNLIPDNVFVTAYKQENNFTIVIVNQSKDKFETQIQIDGKKIKKIESYTSTEDFQWNRERLGVSETTKSRYMTIPAFSLVTLCGEIEE